MPLSAGDKLGPYEIIAPLGAGGMGEVYRALDPRLDREVAIKILHPDKIADEARRQRFIHEAKAASALNHPNIVTIHDIGSEGAMVYMVMELIDGKSLDKLIPPGGMRFSEILKIASAVADAFGKAHSAGIVHRDLKPANVMVSSDGRVKVLDFGLAKLVRPSDPSAADATRTLAGLHTQEGTVMGTAAYMSPEQAEGKPLDARSDIFSFGSLLYEMCSGQRPFRGDSQMSVIASLIREEPASLNENRAEVPPDLARLITRCMRKEPARRAQSMADLKVALDELKEDLDSGRILTPASATAAIPITPAPPTASGEMHKNQPAWRWIIPAALVLVAAVAFALTRMGHDEPVADVPLTPVPLTAYPGAEYAPTFSPDGSQVAFVWNGEKQDNDDIYVAVVGSPTPLRLTTDPASEFKPRWSPDGRYIAFLRMLDDARFGIFLISPLGGGERKVAQFYTKVILGSALASVAWTADSRNLIVSGALEQNSPNRLLLLPLEGGEPKTLAQISGSGEGYQNPDLSPDGRTLAAILRNEGQKIHLWSFGSSKELPNIELKDDRALDTGRGNVSNARWTPDGRDLVFTLTINTPLPLSRISAAGGEVRLMAWTGVGASNPAFSRQGNRMAFARATRDANLWRVSLDGKEESHTIAASSFREAAPHYSPDGKRLAFYSNRGGTIQVWTANADGTHATQLTNMDPQATTGTPVWSPDGQKISFDSDAGGEYHIYVMAADGGQPRQLAPGFISSWSPDGRWIYYTSKVTGRNEIWRVPPEGGTPEQMTKESGTGASLSPDGKWLYYTKNDGGDGLVRRPVDGGPEAKMASSVYRYNYVPLDDGLYWTPGPNPDGSSSIRYLDFKTKTSKEIAKIPKPIDLGLAISPDRKYILFSQLDYTGQDLMLVENFR